MEEIGYHRRKSEELAKENIGLMHQIEKLKEEKLALERANSEKSSSAKFPTEKIEKFEKSEKSSSDHQQSSIILGTRTPGQLVENLSCRETFLRTHVVPITGQFWPTGTEGTST